jgi:molybdate transport system substrate-binding protein
VPKSIIQNSMARHAKVQQLLAAHSGKFAIAQPQLAPFGTVAKAYLETYAANFNVLPNLVFGNNVTQAFQFVDSGNATLGLIAESLLIQANIQFEQDKYLHYLLLDKDRYAAIVQHMLVIDRSESTKTSKQKTNSKQSVKQDARLQQAIAFSQFIISDEVQNQLTQLGYLAVTEMPYE